MKKMKKILCLLLAFALTFGCMSGFALAETGTKPADGVTEEQPFAPGTGGSNQFRIPCLVSLDDGTIVAGCDARWTTYMDGGGLDTIVSYSKDGGATWNYTFANYLGDNGNVHNTSSTAFIDPAMATDGETVWMIADLYPAGIALNGASYAPQTGHRGYDANHNLVLAAATSSVTASSSGANRAAAAFDYHLEKIAGAEDTAESYYAIKDASGNTVEGYTVDAFFNIKGDGVDTNLFCGDSPYFPYPTDFLYMTSSTDGGATWSIPTLLDVKDADEQTLLVGPGRGIVTSSGRIVFTAYEYTSGDKFSCTIYSDDGGVTWERGADVSGWSSEAVVTEADGRLYMFTRHGNCYYVSEDEGETWGAPISVTKPYISTCQLTAITYSEKIDGKTAILFVAPSNTGTRAAGMIYVGLVQEDGSLEWAYDYSINGSAYYAYSCITDLYNGKVGLLYESAASQITYIDIPIQNIVAGAAIGNIWLTSEDEAIGFCEMKPNETAVFVVEGLDEGESVEAVSGNETAATVSVSGNEITVQTGDVEGFAEVDITVKAGTKETSLKLYVTAAEQYELVELAMGERVVYQDNTGDYREADLSGVDTNVAAVTVTGESAEEANNSIKAQLATAVANFRGELIDLEDCLYTFDATGTANQYVISGTTADGQTAYFNLTSSGQTPNQASSVNVNVLVGSEAEQTFKLYDTTQSAHLHFWYADTTKLYFDRCGTSCGASDYIELYTPSETAPADSPIKGYVRVTSQSEIEDGGQYLIARTSTNGSIYVMRPTLNGANYNYVAKYVDTSAVQVQLATANASFNGSTKDLSNCLYTFTASNGNYVISNTTADGTTVYLNPRTSDSRANTATSTAITVAQNGTEAEFSFYDTTSSNNGGYLYFWKNDTAKLYYDRNSSIHENCWFEVFEASADAAVSVLPGYAKVESLSDIKDGGKYLIAMLADDGYYYFLHPSSTSDRYSHVARTLPVDINALNGSTEILIEAVGEGFTSVVIGDMTYFIKVENEVKNITLEIGESVILGGEINKIDETQQVVTLTENTESAPYVQVDELVSGEKYLIGNSSYLVINEEVSITNDPDGLVMKATNLQKDDCAQYLWTVTAVTGGYQIQDANGKYLTFEDSSSTSCAIGIGDAAETVSIVESSHGGYTITDGTYYFNNFRGDNNNVAGWSGDDNAWYFYQADGNVITGAQAGNTVITIGGVNYNITVNGEEEPEIPTPEPPTEVCKVFPDVTHDAWYEEGVQYVYDKSIMGGNNGLFNPMGNITRAQVVTTLYNLEGRPEVTDYSAVDELADVQADQWYTDAVCWAYSVGVANGNSATKMFNMSNPVTRQQLATFFYNYAEYKGLDITTRGDYSDLAGADEVSSYAADTMKWAYGTGLITGSKTTVNGETVYNLNPTGTATRAQVASILMRFCEGNNL